MFVNNTLRRCCFGNQKWNSNVLKSATSTSTGIESHQIQPVWHEISVYSGSGLSFCKNRHASDCVRHPIRAFSSSQQSSRFDDDDTYDEDDGTPLYKRHGVSLGTRRIRPKKPIVQSDVVNPFTDGSGLNKAISTAMKGTGDNSTENDVLSPWTPVPDIVARRALEMAEAGPDDIHIDLGCGDGRVNFHAVDMCNVKRTIGIDHDKAVIDAAVSRLKKRHPLPSNIKFVEANLMDRNSIIWDEYINHATIITMFFATEGLKKLRPLLEEKLRSRTDECTIVCIGYKMPGWRTSTMQSEVVLGTQIHVYHWGKGELADPFLDPLLDMLVEDEDDNDNKNTTKIKDSENIRNKAKKNISSSTRFNGANIIDKSGKFPIRGFNIDNLLVGQKSFMDLDESLLDAQYDPYVPTEEELEEERSQLLEEQAKKNKNAK